MDELIFDTLEPVEIPVTIGKIKYVLTEAREGDASKYQNYHITRARYDGKGKFAGMGEVADSKALLVSLCLWELKELNGQLQKFPVKEQTIKSWPNRITRALFEKAKEISDLDQETEAMLEARIEADTAKLEELREARLKGESTEGNGRSSTAGTSNSAAS